MSGSTPADVDFFLLLLAAPFVARSVAATVSDGPVGAGSVAVAPFFLRVVFDPVLVFDPVSVGVACSAPFAPFDAARVTRLLTGPRTGVRGRKTHPTAVTGFPPISRSGSNSHGCLTCNSWKESFDSTVASTFSAIWRMKASPRPIVPAGGVTSSPAARAAS